MMNDDLVMGSCVSAADIRLQSFKIEKIEKMACTMKAIDGSKRRKKNTIIM